MSARRASSRCCKEIRSSAKGVSPTRQSQTVLLADMLENSMHPLDGGPRTIRFPPLQSMSSDKRDGKGVWHWCSAVPPVRAKQPRSASCTVSSLRMRNHQVVFSRSSGWNPVCSAIASKAADEIGKAIQYSSQVLFRTARGTRRFHAGSSATNAPRLQAAESRARVRMGRKARNGSSNE